MLEGILNLLQYVLVMQFIEIILLFFIVIALYSDRKQDIKMADSQSNNELINRRERTFWNCEDANSFAKEVNGIVTIKFWNCGQKDYIVSWYE